MILIMSILCLNLSVNSDRASCEKLQPAHSFLDTTGLDTMYFDLDGDVIAMPTMFTPDKANARIHFYPTFNNDQIAISQFVINTIEDDWRDVKLIYSTQKLVYRNNDVDHAWDGSDLRSGITKTFHEGSFRFKFYASKPGSFMKCEGVGYLDRSK